MSPVADAPTTFAGNWSPTTRSTTTRSRALTAHARVQSLAASSPPRLQRSSPTSEKPLVGGAQFSVRQDSQVQLSATVGTGLAESTNHQIQGRWYGVRRAISHAQHRDPRIRRLRQDSGVLVTAVQGDVVGMV